MHIAMPRPNAREPPRQNKRDHPEVAVLMLTMHDNEEYVRQVLAAGASGYVLKRAAASELVARIRAVHRGGAVLSPGLTRALIQDLIGREDGPRETAGDDLR